MSGKLVYKMEAPYLRPPLLSSELKKWSLIQYGQDVEMNR